MIKQLLQISIIILLLGSADLVKSQCSPTTVPYFGDISGIIADDLLPPCWAASALGTACKTYTQGYAAFLDISAGPHYFYSQALSLNSGVTYSASVWKKSSFQSSNNGFIGIMLGTTQSATGLTIIASPAPVGGNFYAPTSGTFNVANSGTYYIVVAGTYMGSGTGEYLNWDDLRVEIPCAYPGNSPTVNVVSSASLICAGEPVTLSASGANTFIWSNGSTGSSIVVSPQVTTTYQSSGTSSLTECNTLANITISVNPSPVVIAVASSPSVCVGESATITAGGAQTYSWSSGATTNSTTVSPTIAIQYTVTGTNQYKCSSDAMVTIGVYPLPVINITPATYNLCLGDSLQLNASGAYLYEWSDPLLSSGASLNVSPASNTNYTVTGMGPNGCFSSTVASVMVSECVGLDENSGSSAINIFPNPCEDRLTISENNSFRFIIYDMTGREILRSDLSLTNNIDVSALSRGLYVLSIDQKKIRFVKE